MDGFVNGLGVICSVCGNRGDGIRDLLKKSRDLGAIMCPASSQVRSDDLTCISIDCEVQLTPSPVPGRVLQMTGEAPQPRGGVLAGGRRMREAFSNAYASPIGVGSLHAGPSSSMPIGTPSGADAVGAEKPPGNVIAGKPVLFERTPLRSS